ncbi:glycosyl hydrolase family 26, partial [Vibrio cholerae]|nr:glycosyl hydrolase family 26 [Vibrio cholerae]
MRLNLVVPIIGCLAITLSACSRESDLMPIREQVSTVSITIDNEGEKPPVLYTANINSKTIFCGVKINGM